MYRFLLARLQLESLRYKTNLGDLEDALAALTRRSKAVEHTLDRHAANSAYDQVLGSAYDDALKRVDSQPEDWRQLARKVLMWITYAHRELSIGALRGR